MSERLLELLPEYVLGTLSDAEVGEVERELAGSEALRREADEIRETFGLLGASLTPIPPPAALKTRLLESVQAERFVPFAVPLTRYFDLAVERVRELLKWMNDPKTEWEMGPLPGIALLHFSGGPKVATADVGFVRLPRGLHFPWHRHTGYEVNFILQGTIRDHDGRLYGPGEVVEKASGTEHEFFVGEEEDLLIGVVLEQGFEIVPKPE
jgi:quercetin dioxygenase-like cupin family protein